MDVRWSSRQPWLAGDSTDCWIGLNSTSEIVPKTYASIFGLARVEKGVNLM